MLSDDFYNQTMVQIDEGVFGNMAKIGALAGSIALGGVGMARGEATPPPRPREMSTMYLDNLGMATNDYGLSSYVNVAQLMNANSNDYVRLAHEYVKNNETKGFYNKCFGTYKIPYTIKNFRDSGTNVLANVECYKSYKDSKGIPTVGMGYNFKANWNKVRSYAMGQRHYCLFDKNKKPLSPTKNNIIKAVYLDYKMVDELTDREFTGVVDNLAKKHTSYGLKDWNSLPYPVRVVLIDIMYNVGSISKFKSMIKYINDGEWIKAAKELMDSKAYETDAKKRYCRNASILLKWARKSEVAYDDAMRYADWLRSTKAQGGANPDEYRSLRNGYEYVSDKLGIKKQPDKHPEIGRKENDA